MTNLSSKECLLTIIEGAKRFEENFVNKNFLFVYKDESNAYKFIETIAYRGNFLHLTGVNTNLTQTDFFSKATKSELTSIDFSIKNNSDAMKKLSVMKDALSFSNNAKITGYFNPRFSKNLYTEILVGNKRFALGFVRDEKTGGKYYVPNTLLGGDIKDYIGSAYAIDAIFEKSIGEDAYSNLVHLSKKNKDKGILSLPLPKSIKKLIEPYIKANQTQVSSKQVDKTEGGYSKSNIQNIAKMRLDDNKDDKLNLVACTIEQCGAKLDAEIAQANRTQKETAPQQVSQVGQSRQVGQVKQKTKLNNARRGKDNE